MNISHTQKYINATRLLRLAVLSCQLCYYCLKKDVFISKVVTVVSHLLFARHNTPWYGSDPIIVRKTYHTKLNNLLHNPITHSDIIYIIITSPPSLHNIYLSLYVSIYFSNDLYLWLSLSVNFSSIKTKWIVFKKVHLDKCGPHSLNPSEKRI